LRISIPKRISGLYKAAGVGVVCLILLLLQGAGRSEQQIPQTVFDQLERIRSEKKERLTRYFDGIQTTARNVKEDEVMVQFFETFRRGKTSDQEEYELDKYYVEQYGNFYDILFVDARGYVFHSIRKEADYQKNIFTSFLSETRLARRMKQERRDLFVEYEYYPSSDEAAAFFVVPLSKQAEQLGWFIFQCPINKVNTILTERRGLGRTGEVYLVNQERLMLSDSRFMEDSTILKLKVDTRAVRKALRDGVGERVIRDYRGINVFSSFERFELFGTSWVIIAEIDEDEVITEYYKKKEDLYRKEICRYLAYKPRGKHTSTHSVREMKRVDVNEFARAVPREILQTRGVATCTVIAVLLPGEFGYLAHIPPTDEIYISGVLSKLFLGEQSTDFWGELIERIKLFEVCSFRLRELEIAIIAPHDKSFAHAVDRILAQGIELSQIKFLYNPRAKGANVFLDMTRDSVEVEWYTDQSVFVECISEVDDLGAILKRIQHPGDGVRAAL
jgi:hypothetical protein